MKFMRKMVVQAVLENTIGQDPSTGYTAILTNVGSDIKGVGEVIKRDVVRRSFSPAGHVIGARDFQCTLPIELKGGGYTTDIVVPEVDVLLQACALVKTDAAVISIDSYTASPAFVIGEQIETGITTSPPTVIGTLFDLVAGVGNTATLYLRNVVTANLPTVTSPPMGVAGVTSAATGNVTAVTPGLCYRPTSVRDSMKTATIRYNLDGIRHIASGCRGTFTLDLSVGKYGVFSFNLQGTFTDPTDTDLPSVSYSDIIPPIVFGAGLKIGSWDMSTTATTQITFDLGNTVVPRNDVNAATGRLGFEITGREPKGTLNPETGTMSAYNAWGLWKAATAGKVYCQIGSTQGNRCRILIPEALYSDVAYQNRDGIIAYQLPFICKEGTDGTDGDNEVYFLFT